MTAATQQLILDSLPRPGTPPADRADLEDRLDFQLAVLDAIRRMDERIASRHRGGQADREAVAAIHRLYESWYGSAGDALQTIEYFEARGEAPANADEFRRACRTSHVPGLEPDALHRAADQFARGAGRPLGEVMDGVRRRTVG